MTPTAVPHQPAIAPGLFATGSINQVVSAGGFTSDVTIIRSNHPHKVLFFSVAEVTNLGVDVDPPTATMVVKLQRSIDGGLSFQTVLQYEAAIEDAIPYAAMEMVQWRVRVTSLQAGRYIRIRLKGANSVEG